MINQKLLDRLIRQTHWNSKSTLPVVGIEIRVLLTDGTIWRCKRDSWVTSYDSDPEYKCLTTGYLLPHSQVVGWSYG
jgi:hypothetical protein